MMRFFLLIVLLSTSISLFASWFQVDGIRYGTIGGNSEQVEVIANQYSGDIIIPESVNYEGKTYNVTSIRYTAFSGCSSLTSVTIPNSVTSIGEYAFSECNSLTSVTIPNSVISIGGSAFFGCSALTSVNIPNGVESIEMYTFEGCSSLTSVTIPNGVTSIGSGAFAYCSGLTSVTIGNSVTSIGEYAFYRCSGLTSVNIPNGVESIESYTFEECSSLSSVTIPNGVKSIGSDAFFGCSALTSVTIPNSVTSIGYRAFSGCSSLSSVTIPNSVTSIGNRAFSSCSSLTSVTIPNSVTSIGSYSFIGCSSLTSVTIPNSVTSIGEYAFSSCSSLTSVNIPNSVTSIGDSAFDGCSSLTSVNIPNGVKSIEIFTFQNCSSLTSVTIPNSVISIGGSAFSGCNGLTYVNIPNSVTTIGSNAFNGCNRLTFRIESPTPIELNAPIINNDNLHNRVSLEVPIGSTVAYANANYWNEAMKIYANNKGKNYYPILPIITHIGETILSINRLSGEGVELSEDDVVTVQVLKNDEFPYSMVMKGGREITDFFTNGTYNYKPVANYRQNILSTFSYPYKDVRLSESGTLIDQIGIENLDDLECLKVSGDLNGTDILTIRKMKNLKLLDLSDAHIVNGGLSYYKNYTTSENAIGEYFYEGLNKLLRIKLPNDIHTIKDNAFKTCNSILTIKIPSSVRTIYSVKMLQDMSNIQSLQIEDLYKWCTTKFKDSPWAQEYRRIIHLFLNDEEIFDLKIPEGISTIPGSCFFGFNWLRSVTIPSSVTEIGAYAFDFCSNLISVISQNPIPPHIAYIPYSSTRGAFDSEVEKNAVLYVPKGSKTQYWLHPLWENFKNIVELDDTSINDNTIDPSPKSKGVYTIGGVKLSANADNIENLSKGIYIINGEKVVIK